MAQNYIGFKIPPETRAAVIERADAEGISASEWIRALIFNALEQGVPSTDEGYKQARSLSARMASGALAKALADLPSTYEEYLAMIADEETPRLY